MLQAFAPPLDTIVLHYWDQVNARGAGWSVKLPSKHGWWIELHHPCARPRPQGWKLHISATVVSIQAVLQQTLPILLAANADFKVIASVELLIAMNNGAAGISQIGKSITVYPNDDEQSIRLALELHNATRGLRGPMILSDRPFAPGSLVHYRYGGFDNRWIQVPLGPMLPAINLPDGTLVPDLRALGGEPPEGISDPFIAAGVTPPPAPIRPLDGGRYLLEKVVTSTARGTVARAIDQVMTRRCILKRASRDAQVYEDGLDARDRLRHGAAILELLAPDPLLPQVYDLFTYDDDLILVMEDSGPETLAEYIVKLAYRGLFVKSSQAVDWLRQIAMVLARLHGQGLIYGDLKATNLMISSAERLCLIDLDSVYDLHTELPKIQLGTRGYTSPQQRAGTTPAVTDDIYSLGALGYFLVTGAEPSLAPNPTALLERSPSQINQSVGPALTTLLARCLHPDAAQRFPSMTTLIAALDTCREQIVDEAAAPISTSAFTLETTATLCEQLVTICADLMCAEAALICQNSATTSRDQVLSLGLADGVAGLMLGLSKLVTGLHDQQAQARLADLTTWSLNALQAYPPLIPGLAYGQAGIGIALLHAGCALEDAHVIDAALALGRTIPSTPDTGPDVTYGAAGRLWLSLLLYRVTDDPLYLKDAMAIGDHLLTTGEEDHHGGMYWQLPAYYRSLSKVVWVNYAHGSAGIGDALLSLSEISGIERYYVGAASVYQSLSRFALPVLRDHPGVWWPKYEGGPTCDCSWWYGGAGITRFLLHAARQGIAPEASTLATQAIHTVSRGIGCTDATLAQGLAGGIDVLLTLASDTGEQHYQDEARRLIHLLSTFIIPKDEHKKTSFQHIPVRGYLGGLGGIVDVLLSMRTELQSVQASRYHDWVMKIYHNKP